MYPCEWNPVVLQRQVRFSEDRGEVIPRSLIDTLCNGLARCRNASHAETSRGCGLLSPWSCENVRLAGLFAGPAIKIGFREPAVARRQGSLLDLEEPHRAPVPIRTHAVR